MEASRTRSELPLPIYRDILSILYSSREMARFLSLSLSLPPPHHGGKELKVPK